MRAGFGVAMGLLVASSVLAGCIDLAVFPSEVPATSLAPGWAADAGNTQAGTIGQEPIVRAHYHVNAYRDPGNTNPLAPEGSGVILVVSVPDAPLLDEQAEIDKRIQAVMAENGVQLLDERGATGAIGAQQVAVRLFNATMAIGGVQAKGRAVDIPYQCAGNGQNVRVFGYAVVEAVVGIRQVTSFATWQEVAGDIERTNVLGGMVASVKCS